MRELTRYLPVHMLQAGWELGPSVRARYVGSEAGRPDRAPIKIESSDPVVAGMITDESMSPKDRSVLALQFRSLSDFMRAGPVIIRPSADLAQVMIDTEVNINAADFRSPYPVVGVELGQEITGQAQPSLMLVWRLSPECVFVWTMLPNGITYHITAGDDLPTIEARLEQAEGAESEEDYRIFVHGTRLAVNLCLLATQREVIVEPLPANVARHRRRQDARLNALAARQAQEIRFKDLIVKPRRAGYGGLIVPTGYSQDSQFRRGHWKMVAHGPRHSLRKHAWIEPYWTKTQDRDEDRPGPTTILE